MPAPQDTCCFTGHRPEKLPWGMDESDRRCLALKQRIRAAVEQAYDDGYRHFICGMAKGCDLYFCEAALALRQERPDVTVEAAIPCPEQAHSWRGDLKRRYEEMVAECDMETVVSDSYTRWCMQRRDRYMVDHAARLIAVYNGTPGGTRYTYLYALKRGLEIVDVEPGTEEEIP